MSGVKTHCDCVCGGQIYASRLDPAPAVAAHNASAQHIAWRRLVGIAVTDEELLGRVPLGDPTIDPDLVDLSGVLLDASGGDAAPGKEAA